MKLRDIGQVIEKVRRRCESLYGLKGFSLTRKFIEKYRAYIRSSEAKGGYKDVSFDRGVCMFVSAKDNKISYAPQIGFAIAYELVDLYRELWLYREKVVSVFPNIKTYKKDSPEPVIAAIKSSNLCAQDKTYLCKFLSDYDWWGGGKSIDRLDFSVSPLMKCAGLQAESQSVMEEIAGQFANSKELYEAFGFESESEIADEDCLGNALRCFKEHRDEFAMGKKVNEGIRAYFDPLTEDDLRNFTEEQFVDLFLGKEKYEHMWSGTNGKGWGHIKKCGRKAAMNFIADLKAIPVPAEVFCGKDFEAPNGFGRVTIAELQLKFRPEEFCAYSKRTAAAFRILKLDEREFNGNFSAADYNAVLAITENIRGRMEAMGIGRTRDDNARPDYLTANEFIDFVVENEDAVRELVGDEPPPVSADALSVALQLFRDNRYGEVWQKNVIKDSYLNVFASEGLSSDEIQGLSIDDFKTKLLDLVWAFQNGGARTYGQLSGAEKSEYKDFVVGLKKGLRQFDAYFPPSTKCPKGMGVGMISELLMRFYPKSCCSYNAELIHDGLVTLGLAKGEFEWPKTPSIYQDFMGKCVKILRKMEEMKFARTPEVGNKEAPDYITVNEFLWFVHDNKDLIKKEVLKMSVKPVKHDKRPNEERKELKLNLGEKDDRLMLRLMAALRTKPFAILAGHSGTGKSRMVRRLAYMTCRDGSLRDEQTGKVGNFCMIQVKPNWHDSTDLLGYYSSMGGSYQPTEFVKFIEKAYAYPHVPFFVCLDEMNLAPVEQYFAEYLSAIESMRKNASGEFVSDPIVAKDVYRDIKGLEPEFTESVAWLEKYGLTIPRNLFVVGTVNMDETTNEFSRKVLDRAMTIEMTDVAFENFKKTSPEPTFADCLKDEPIDNLMGGEVQAADLSESQLKNLNAIKAVLASTAFAVAYRFANEYALYADSLARFNCGDDSAAFDHMVLMKVLPRIAGDSEMVKKIFAGLKGVLSSETESHKKMIEIEERDGEDLTFWP